MKNQLAAPPPVNYTSQSVKKQARSPEIAKGSCAGAEACPLSRVPVGATVCIKSFAASPEIRAQLRSLGICEEQEVKLLSRDANFVCEVCDAKLDLERGTGRGHFGRAARAARPAVEKSDVRHVAIFRGKTVAAGISHFFDCRRDSCRRRFDLARADRAAAIRIRRRT